MQARRLTLMLLVLAPQLTSAAGSDSPRTLPEFEQTLRASSWFTDSRPDADRKAPNSLLAGASAFATSGLASVDEVIDVGRRRSYQQMSVAGGIRIPLLGSRFRHFDGLVERELAELGYAAERELQQRELLTRLSRAYLELWSARVRRELALDYQRTAPMMTPVLQRRQAAAMLLESDRLEFMSNYARAASENSQAEADERSASAELEGLTGASVGSIARPRVELRCKEPMRIAQELDTLLDEQPELQVLRARSEYYENRSSGTALRAVQSDLRVGVSSSYEPQGGDPGKSAFVTLSFDYAFGAVQTERSAARLQLNRAADAYHLRRVQISSELRRLLETRRTLESSTVLAGLGLEASAARLRERELRAARLAGDVIEQLQQARYANYRAMLAEHLATRAQIEWQISLASYLPTDCGQAERS